ncbi:hypothetical protein D3C87_1700250 [compost metagenome]
MSHAATITRGNCFEENIIIAGLSVTDSLHYGMRREWRQQYSRNECAGSRREDGAAGRQGED